MDSNPNIAEAPTPKPIADGRPCSICGQYQVGAENAWLCYRCGFDGPLAPDKAATLEPAA